MGATVLINNKTVSKADNTLMFLGVYTKLPAAILGYEIVTKYFIKIKLMTLHMKFSVPLLLQLIFLFNN